MKLRSKSNKKWLELFFVLLFGACEELTQINPQPEAAFVKLYGGAFDQSAHAVIGAIGGGYLLVGNTNSHTLGNDTSMYIIKTDQFGNEQWSKVYNSPGRNEIAWAIDTLFGQSGYVLAGSSRSSSGSTDALITLIDLQGNIKKQILFSALNQLDLNIPSSQENAKSVLVDKKGNIVFGGSILGENGELDTYLFKLDPNGEKLSDWEQFRVWGFPGNEIFAQLLELANEEIGVLSQTDQGSPGLSGSNLLFYKTNEYGIPIASKNFGTANTDLVATAHQHSEGYVLVGTQKKSPNSSSGVPFVIELDLEFNQLRQSSLIPVDTIKTSSKIAHSIYRNEDQYYMLGTNTAQGSRSFFILRTDLNGTVLAESNFGIFDGASAGTLIWENNALLASGTVVFGANKMACLIKVNPLTLKPNP